MSFPTKAATPSSPTCARPTTRCRTRPRSSSRAWSPIHSIWHSRGQLDVTKYTPEELASLPPVPQRVVRTHPGSHRKTLYLAAHASHIEGMPVADGRLLLMDLMEHATRPQFVHAHKWREGDLVIWDNRCTMHRARPFDTTKVRDLRRVTTRDVASTLEQAA